MSIGIPVLFTPEPDIIWDSYDKRHDKAISAVERFDCAKAVLQVVSSGGIKENAIKFKPELAKSGRIRDTRYARIDGTPN